MNVNHTGYRTII